MISNTLTLRKFFLWSSQWFCDYNYYSLLFEDIKITNYLQSIFFSLKYPTSHFIIKRYVYKVVIQSTFYIVFWFKRYLNKKKIFFFFRKHQRYLINHFAFKKSVYFFTKRICNKLYFYIYKSKKCKLNYFTSFFINFSSFKYSSYNKSKNFFFRLIEKNKFIKKTTSLLRNLFNTKSNLLKKIDSLLFHNNNAISHNTYDDEQQSFFDALSSYLFRLYYRKTYRVRTKVNVNFLRRARIDHYINIIKNKKYYYKHISNNFFSYKNFNEYFFFTSVIRSKILLKKVISVPEFKYIKSKEFYSKIPLFLFNMFFFLNKRFFYYLKKKKSKTNIYSFIHNIKKKIKKKKVKVKIKTGFTIDDRYNYFLCNYYLFNNRFKKYFFLKKKYLSIYSFLKKFNFLNIHSDLHFTIYNKDYYLWSFFILKLNSHFYNKFFYMYFNNVYNIHFKLLKIIYYYSLISYKINKLFFFMNFLFKNNFKMISVKPIGFIITLIAKKKLTFIKNIQKRLNKKKTFFFHIKFARNLNSFINFKNYITKKYSNFSKNLIKAEKSVYSLQKYTLSSLMTSFKIFLKYNKPLMTAEKKNTDFRYQNLYSFIKFDRSKKFNALLNVLKKKKKILNIKLLYLLILYKKKNRFLFNFYKSKLLFYKKKKTSKYFNSFFFNKKKKLIDIRIVKIKKKILKISTFLRKYKKHKRIYHSVFFSKKLTKKIKWVNQINNKNDIFPNKNITFCKNKQISWINYFYQNYDSNNNKKKKLKLFSNDINSHMKKVFQSFFYSTKVRQKKIRQFNFFFLLYQYFYYYKIASHNKWSIFLFFTCSFFLKPKTIWLKKKKK